MKFLKILIISSLIALSCAAQTQKDLLNSETKVCWQLTDSIPEDASFNILYRRYQSNDEWKFLSDASTPLKIVNRPGFGKYEIGVIAIVDGDTSYIHSSTDSTACVKGTCGGECTEVGPWYAYWRITGLKLIHIEN